jgi:hypothetical protein
MKLKVCRDDSVLGEVDLFAPKGKWLGTVLTHGDAALLAPAYPYRNYSLEELVAITSVMDRLQAPPVDEPIATQVLTAAVTRFNRLKAEAVRRCPWTH